MRLAHRRMPLGEDILLARHGSNIAEMTQDRKRNLTRARLCDGSTDTASNHLVNLNAMASLTPAERMSKVAENYTEDRLSVSRSEIRFMAKLSGIWLVASTALIMGFGWAIYNYGDPEMLVQMMNTPMM
jgi:hypothetical protein